MLDDLVAGAARLTVASPEDRVRLAGQMLDEAHAAHHYVKRFRRPHPAWGNGSLMARAMQGGFGPKQPLCFASLAIMAAAVAKFRNKTRAKPLGL